MDSKVFKQINTLKAQLRAATSKTLNAEYLLEKAREEVKDLKAQLRQKDELQQTQVGNEDHTRKLIKLRKENHQLQSENQRLEEDKAHLAEEVKTLDRKLDDLDDIIRSERTKSADLSKNYEMAKSLAAKQEIENRDLKVELKQVELRENQLKKISKQNRICLDILKLKLRCSENTNLKWRARGVRQIDYASSWPSSRKIQMLN